MEKKRIAVFASGNGTNAIELINKFSNHPAIEVSLVVTNNPNAGILEKIRDYDTDKEIIDNIQANNAEFLIRLMKNYSIDYIVLAGYLRKIPQELIQTFADKIINIHPSLLPKFGGRGMYGIHVHNAVLEAKEHETGITVHLVNNEYDKGRILAQHKLKITEGFTAEKLQRAVQELELKNFSVEIEKYLLK
ncbi:MAG: formyltransferase family protein [Brumimicrobium sp.]|nr:formyltransferase family protein [Brumimicrobium sp.]